MSVKFNYINLTYKGHNIAITYNLYPDYRNMPDFKRVTIVLDEGDVEEVVHVANFDDSLESLIEALDIAKVMIDSCKE